jgi:biotin transport system substrate-specific component
MNLNSNFAKSFVLSLLLLLAVAPLQFGFLDFLPVSLQSLVILWIAFVFGCSPAFWAVAAYLLLAALGLPVLSGYRGGWEHFVGPTAGFLVGFPVVTYLVGKYRKRVPMHLFWLFVAFLAGHLALLIFGYLGLAAHQLSFLEIMSEYYSLLPGTILKSAVGAFLVRIEFWVRDLGK